MVDAVASAAKPRRGSSAMIRLPSDRMIRQPPAYVPADKAPAEIRTTHHGISKPWW
jgi:hypothetical protein